MAKLNVGVVTFPISASGITPLSNLIRVLQPLSYQIHLITGNAGYTYFKENTQIRSYGVVHKEGKNALTRVIKYFWTQLKFVPLLIKIARDVDLFVFFMGQDMMIPILTAKLLRKPVILSLEGSAVEISRARNDLLTKPLDFLVRTDFSLSDKIVVYSERLIKEYGLGGHREKILVAPRHFLDFNNFNVKKKLSEREIMVGYIGRLSKEKGVLEFVEAIPMVLEGKLEVMFVIIGEGELQDAIEDYMEKKQLSHCISLSGWISRKEIPSSLNDLRLLVLPSYTEGLPNIMLEAMACGTPVLAASVGSIPDIVRDGYTGFLMSDNSPRCIAENVIRALNHPSLEHIVEAARALVQREYQYESAVERYSLILKMVLNR